MACHRCGESLAHGSRRRFGHHRGDHHEPGVIVDAGHQLALTPVGQEYPAHDVELPQLHRGIALPAPVLALVGLSLSGH